MHEIDGHPERIIPKDTSEAIRALHEVRYNFAKTFLKGRVLDAGCGVGYGTAILSQTQAHVVGMDLDKDALEVAVKEYQDASTPFLRGDVHNLPYQDHVFDWVISFENIEHLPDVEKYLKEVARVVKPEGGYIVSTPMVKKTNPKPDNPHHVIEWSRKDFEALLGTYFKSIDSYGQSRKHQSKLHHMLQKIDMPQVREKIIPKRFTSKMTQAMGTKPLEEIKLDDVEITNARWWNATEIVCVCKEPIAQT